MALFEGKRPAAPSVMAGNGQILPRLFSFLPLKISRFSPSKRQQFQETGADHPHPEMPPKRKSPATAAPAAGSPRKTRSMTGAEKRGAEAAPAKASPAKKEEKEAAALAAVQNGRKRASKKDATEKEAAEPKGRKKAKKGADSAAAKEEDGGGATADVKRVIVEACTQCRQFKIRAQKVKEDLESSVSGVSVIINPEKPRRGCLEIREEGGEVFISLLNMPRPFTAMKKLNMDEVIKDIAKKIS